MAESMITTSAWVPRGFAAPFPSRYTFDEAEFERIAQLAKLQLDDANEDLEEAKAAEAGDTEDEITDGVATVSLKKDGSSKKETKAGEYARTIQSLFSCMRRHTHMIIGSISMTMTLKNMTSSTTMTTKKMSRASEWTCSVT